MAQSIARMMRDDLIRRLRRVKLRLASGGPAARLLVPLVEVGEFSLSHGLREVISRSRMRLAGHPTPPPPPAFAAHLLQDDASPIAIPAANVPVQVSIVIPVLNNPVLTRGCLRSIVNATPAGSYEVIAVDNGSDAPAREVLAAVTGLRVIQNQVNEGFVQACNQGAAIAQGEFVLFLNNDTVVLDGWLDALVTTLRRDVTAGAAGARLVYPNGRLQEAGGIVWSDGDGWNYGHNENPDAPEYGYVREVDYCSGACLIVRRELFRQLDGFDSRYAPAFYEDTDLAFRIREAGFRVLYQPKARVIHYGGATAGTDKSSGLKSYQVVNHEKFKLRHAAALARQRPHDPEFLRRACDRRRGLRILVIDHMVPHHDHDAGSVRMMALLTILIELGHRVTFLPDNLAGIEPYTSELQQLGIEVRHGREDYGFAKRRGGDFDVVILCRAHFAAAHLPELKKHRSRMFVIFDTVDLHFLREERFAKLDGDPSLGKAAARTRAVELKVMRASDMVWVTSRHEREVLEKETSLPPVAIVPMIHTVRTDVPGFHSRRDLLFVGGFRHAPNEDAVVYFAEEIFPRIRAALSGVRFIIVGSHVPPAVSRLASDDIVVKGFVPDLAPIVDGCRVAVAPLRYGAGIKGKVTQSLAWGLPVVATPVAAEGMDVSDGEQLIVASDPAAFADRLVALYGDEAMWRRLSDAGRRHVLAQFGHDAIRSSVGSLLATVRAHDGD